MCVTVDNSNGNNVQTIQMMMMSMLEAHFMGSACGAYDLMPYTTGNCSVERFGYNSLNVSKTMSKW